MPETRAGSPPTTVAALVGHSTDSASKMSLCRFQSKKVSVVVPLRPSGVDSQTLTIRSGSSRLVVTKNSALMSYNDQIVLLPSPVVREEGRWLVPIEFLTTGLKRLTGTEFRYRPGASRIFADNVEAPELEMNAQTLGPITRVTIRCGVSLKIDVSKDSQKAVLMIDRPGLDPVRERLDHRDA